MSDEPTMQFYSADGKRVSEGEASRQYLSNDPARPDAKSAASPVFGAVSTEPPAPLQYYDANGKRVAEGSDAATRQYAADDPARPDAKAKDEPDVEAAKEPNAKAISGPAENKAVKEPAAKK